MDRHTGIVIAASVVIASSVAYSAFNVMTLDQIQIRWNDRGSFGFITMLNGGVIEVCNSSFVPLSFHGISIVMLWEGNEIGRFVTNGATVQPNSSVEIDGEGTMTGMAAGILSMYVDTEMSGNDIATINSDSMSVVTLADTAILGIVPFSAQEQYSGPEFFEMMNDRSGDGGC